MSGDELSEEELVELRRLLVRFQNTFSRNDGDLGRTNVIQHRINTGAATPIRQARRRLPIGKREMEQAEVRKMLENGIIEPSVSPWRANPVLVVKSDGKCQFCVDYRDLNRVTVADAVPAVQVELAKEDRPKTALGTSLGLFLCDAIWISKFW